MLSDVFAILSSQDFTRLFGLSRENEQIAPKTAIDSKELTGLNFHQPATFTANTRET
ncbi:MAG: hypothetical protein HY774_06925 [Acidobacteria bacterium]|nr:hypothetical protein [Acidobacteriota bacterium]